jgi:hypothetical protein
MFGIGTARRIRKILATATVATLAFTFNGPHLVMAQEPQWNWGTSRQLRTCPDKTSPKKGAMTVAMATTYVGCFYEERKPYNANVTFVDVLSLQIIGKKNKPTTREIMLWPEIDRKRPVYLLRGSLLVHTCANITGNEYGPEQGSNCSRSEVPKAKGNCWVDLVGEWSCYLGGSDPSPKRKQPAP